MGTPGTQGDGITVEFEEYGDAPVLAAAAVLCHTRALRSTGIDRISWRFHAGVDFGEVVYDHNNVTGHCLNRASKLGKRGDGKRQAMQVLLTSEAAERCSKQLLQEPISRVGEDVVLAKEDDLRVRPRIVHSAEAIARLAAHLQEVCDCMQAQLPLSEETEASVNVGPSVVAESGSDESRAG